MGKELTPKQKRWPASIVTMRKVTELTPYANNSRTHSQKQVNQIAASINEWGWTIPVLVDEAGTIVAGHGRILAAQKLGIEEVPTMTANGWSEAQKKSYVLADNKLALNAGWDEDLLRLEIEGLEGLGFDIDLTGFNLDEIQSMGFDSGEDVGMPDLADGDREPFQQKTFTLHDEQAAIVDDAITLARTLPGVDTGLNENGNGNALALICEQWVKNRNV